MTAKDFIGNELAVGDEIVFMTISYRDLRKGKIIKITPKMVIIDYGCRKTIKQNHDQVVKIIAPSQYVCTAG